MKGAGSEVCVCGGSVGLSRTPVFFLAVERRVRILLEEERLEKTTLNALSV